MMSGDALSYRSAPFIPIYHGIFADYARDQSYLETKEIARVPYAALDSERGALNTHWRPSSTTSRVHNWFNAHLVRVTRAVQYSLHGNAIDRPDNPSPYSEVNGSVHKNKYRHSSCVHP